MTTAKQQWTQGIGAIKHNEDTQHWVKKIISLLPNANEEYIYTLFAAADRIANAAMWLVVHQTYARTVKINGEPLQADDFKINPQGHTGGSLNMAVAYVGHMLANTLTQTTRAWMMGQGHCVSAIDSVNLLLNNMRLEHADCYSLTESGLTQFVTDFYSYRLDSQGHQDSPLGSHVNVNTAGAILEGGYLGFADLQYIHIPLPGETLVTFLSDGAFEEQRGSDWAPRWWRAEDSGFAIPIMIFNGRRIDQRSTMAQGSGLEGFVQHLKNNSFAPKVFDGADPAAFACMILEAEYALSKEDKKSYPISLPYGIAVTEKGAGFYGAGTNAAHGLPLVENPYSNSDARENFNIYSKKLFIPLIEILKSRDLLNNHTENNRPKEKDHKIANRQTEITTHCDLPYREINTSSQISPMLAIDKTFLAYVKANQNLRVRVGNPDEMVSNHMQTSLLHLKHRVTEIEMEDVEAIDGKVITALNEEAVVCACLGNKAGLNLVVTYEAFAPKMLGALRQELIWSDHLLSKKREPGWISVPLILTSHTYENGKNERSHQDTLMAEAMLGEPADISHVLFPADYNSAVASLDACYKTKGNIFTLIVPKYEKIKDVFSQEQAIELMLNGVINLSNFPLYYNTQVILTAVGAYQLIQTLLAAERLKANNIIVAVNYMLEPGRFRDPRGQREKLTQTLEITRQLFYPSNIFSRIFVSHIRPEVMAGLVRPLDTGKQTIFLGYTNHGGTLNTEGMLFVNRQNWGHIVRACARSLNILIEKLLSHSELEALHGKKNPQGILC